MVEINIYTLLRDYIHLLTKLNHYGIRGNVHERFKSYLSHREQFVIVSGHDSISLPLTCGVQQGSILGPLLSLL